jgi:ribose transport system substrate-binding protein
MKREHYYRFFVGTLILSVIAIFFYMSVLRDAKEEEYQVSVIVNDSSAIRWDSLKTGIENAAENGNVAVSVITTDQISSFDTEKSIIENEIDNGADALILQSIRSDEADRYIERISAHTTIALIDSTCHVIPESGTGYALVTPDGYQIGEKLTNELVRDLGTDLSDKTIGVIHGSTLYGDDRTRFQGFVESLNRHGGKVTWEINLPDSQESLTEELAGRAGADAVVALDNDSLELMTEQEASGEDTGTLLYGSGNSSKVVYYLDKRVIRSVVVPNEITMGYQSVMKVVSHLKNPTTPMEKSTVSFRVVRPEDIFTEEYQGILFPIVQ